MTSVPFELNINVLSAKHGRLKYGTVEFRFTTRHARALEKAAGTGIDWVVAKGQSVEALVLLVCYGLQWNEPQMTEDKACDIVDAFIDVGGDTAVLSKAAFQALRASGVYGRHEAEPAADADGDRPLAPMPETPATGSDAGLTA